MDSTGKSIKSILTIRRFDDRIIEDGTKELTKQITQILVRLRDQTTFRNQVSFYCHFEKTDEGDYQRKHHHIRLEMKHVKLKHNYVHHLTK